MKTSHTYDILLAIKPEYVDRIFSGSKQYEYRRTIPKKKINKVYIYATFPVKKVVGYFIFSTIIYENISKLWLETKESSGISKSDFLDYFAGKDHGYAYHIQRVVQFKNPQTLKITAPQSFIYYNSPFKELV